MDIAGALLDGVGDHGVDQADNGGLAGHVAKMFKVGRGLLVFAVAGGGFGVRLRRRTFDGVEDLLLGRQRGAHFEAGIGAHGRHRLEIERSAMAMVRVESWSETG